MVGDSIRMIGVSGDGDIPPAEGMGLFSDQIVRISSIPSRSGVHEKEFLCFNLASMDGEGNGELHMRQVGLRNRSIPPTITWSYFLLLTKS